jgi:hypothetical protein
VVKCEPHVDFVDTGHARRRVGIGEARLLKKSCVHACMLLTILMEWLMISLSTFCRPSAESSLGVRKGTWAWKEDLFCYKIYWESLFYKMYLKWRLLALLRQCVHKYGEGKWYQIPLKAGTTYYRSKREINSIDQLFFSFLSLIITLIDENEK